MTPQTLFTSWPSYYSWGNQGQSRLVAYFSMEIAITPAMPTYSGGLGVLSGDTLRAAADMRLPLVAVTLAHRRGLPGLLQKQLADFAGRILVYRTRRTKYWNALLVPIH